MPIERQPVPDNKVPTGFNPTRLGPVLSPLAKITERISQSKELLVLELKKGRDLFTSKNTKQLLASAAEITSNLNQITESNPHLPFDQLQLTQLDSQGLMANLEQFQLGPVEGLDSYASQLTYLEEMVSSLTSYYDMLLNNKAAHEDLAILNPNYNEDKNFRKSLTATNKLVKAYTKRYIELSTKLTQSQEPYLPYTLGFSDRVVNPSQFITDSFGLDKSYDTNRLERQSKAYYGALIEYYQSQGYPIPKPTRENIFSPTSITQMIQKAVNQLSFIEYGDNASQEFNQRLSSQKNVLAVVNAPTYSTMDNVDKMDAMVITKTEGSLEDIPQNDRTEILRLLTTTMVQSYLGNSLSYTDYPENNFSINSRIRKLSKDPNKLEEKLISEIKSQVVTLMGTVRKSNTRGYVNPNHSPERQYATKNAQGEAYLIEELRSLNNQLLKNVNDTQLIDRISKLKILIGYSDDNYQQLLSEDSEFYNPLVSNQSLPTLARPNENISLFVNGSDVLKELSEFYEFSNNVQSTYLQDYNLHLETLIAEETKRIKKYDFTGVALKLRDSYPSKSIEELADMIYDAMISEVKIKYAIDPQYLKQATNQQNAVKLNYLLRKYNLRVNTVQLKDRIDEPVIAKLNNGSKFNRPSAHIKTTIENTNASGHQRLYSGLMSTESDPTNPEATLAKTDIETNYRIFLGLENGDNAYLNNVSPFIRKTIDKTQATMPLTGEPILETVPYKPQQTPTTVSQTPVEQEKPAKIKPPTEPIQNLDYTSLDSILNFKSEQPPINPEIKKVIYTGLLGTFQVGKDQNENLVAYDKYGDKCTLRLVNGNLIIVPNGVEGINDLSMKRYIVTDIFSKLTKQ